MKKESGITLIALVVTIIILLILAGVSITTLSGDGLFGRASSAGEKYQAASETENSTITSMMNKYDRYEQDNPYKYYDKNNDAASQFESQFDAKSLGLAEGEKRAIGEVYTDDMIGLKVSYIANSSSGYTGKWIILGKDDSGNILITTERPIDNKFQIKMGPEAWLKYESSTDATYGLNYACSKYGGTIQGVNVTSRSITLDDINYVAGLKPKTITIDGESHNIQSFDSYEFGNTMDYNNKKVNYMYPVLSGGTSADGTGTVFWKKPTSENEITLQDNWYGYYVDWDDKQYYYWQRDIGNTDTSLMGMETSKLKYIWGGDSENTCYNEYLVASRTIRIEDDSVGYYVAAVGYSTLEGDWYYLCGSDSEGAQDGDESRTFGIRPVVTIPSSILIEYKNNKIDLAD